MWSKLVQGSKRPIRGGIGLLSASPWLAGAAVLAVTTAGLFTWFFTQRWDDVDVSVPSPRAVPAASPRESGTHVSSPFREVASAEPLDEAGEGGVAAFAVHRTTSPETFALSSHESGQGTEVRPAAAEAIAPAASVRGAWLTGLIEDIADEEPLRHAEHTRWPGLAEACASRRW
ncbi:MAG TPA: hypothetical protein VML55_16050 [Planctomycetaceae bacterium]|nr:hypothetical protein [Planctomycetaceae bacterium]